MSNKHWKKVSSLKDDGGRELASLYEDKKGRRKAKSRESDGWCF